MPQRIAKKASRKIEQKPGVRSQVRQAQKGKNAAVKSMPRKSSTPAARPTAILPKTRPALVWVLYISLVVLSLGGFVGGIGLLADQTGALLGMNVELLQNTFVQDYFWPGLFLLVFMALLPLFVIYSLWVKPEWKQLSALNPWKQEHWSLTLTAALGVFLIGWIVFQITQIGPFPSMQIFIASLGVILLVGALLPQVRAYYAS